MTSTSRKTIGFILILIAFIVFGFFSYYLAIEINPKIETKKVACVDNEGNKILGHICEEETYDVSSFGLAETIQLNLFPCILSISLLFVVLIKKGSDLINNSSKEKSK